VAEASTERNCQRLAALRGNRIPHESVWSEVFRYMAPERAHGFNGSQVTATDAQARKAEIFDSTAIDAGRLFASGMASGMHPANSIWFGLDVGQESEEERKWLDMAARVIFENIHAANFDAQTGECYADLVPAGWFVLYTSEAEAGGYDFEHWPLAQCFISSSKPGGAVDTIFREFELSIEQLVNEYGIDNVSHNVREKYQNKDTADLDAKVQVLWCIYPRTVYSAGGSYGSLAKNKKFASCHYELSDKHQLRESGYDEFPCAVPRWRLVPGTPYATGPGSDALPDVKTINDIKRLELANLDIAVSGMWKAVDDGVLNPKTVRIGPRKIIMMADIKNFEALKSGADFQVSFAKCEDLQRSIRKILLADQLMPQEGPAMTATEVHARVQLIRQQMGPIFGRLQSEFLQSVIERCFYIAYRAGVLGKAPDSLQGRNFAVKYVSPLARAQRLEEVTAIDVFLAGLAAVFEFDPTIIDLVDMEAAQREKAIALGVPSKIVRSQDDVTARREAKAQAAAEAQQQAQQAQMAATAGETLMQSAAAA
jgi:hypothetical protein